MMARSDGSTPFIAVSTGIAKYEQAFRSIVWRIDQLPKRDQGAYKTHLFECKISVPAHDPIPEKYHPTAEVEYSMSQAFISHCQVKRTRLPRTTMRKTPPRFDPSLCQLQMKHRRNGFVQNADFTIRSRLNMHLKKKNKKNLHRLKST